MKGWISVVNLNWYNLFTGAKVLHGLIAYSDQFPLILDMEGKAYQNAYGGTKPFRFEVIWVTNDRCIKSLRRIGTIEGPMHLWNLS